MASFSAGTTFTDGVANDVTAAKLGALINNATPTSGLIQDRTAETSTAVDDTLMIGDASDSNALKRITVANFAQTLPTAKITTGTIETATLGTTTGTLATFTNSNITSGTVQTLTSSTLSSNLTGGTYSGTINSSNGTFGGLSNGSVNSTSGTIQSLTSSTLSSNLTGGTYSGTINSTTGTVVAGTFGTTTSTAATITTGTIPTLVATTKITTATGTEASPALSPTGDTDTGMFFPAANTLAFSTNGTQAVRINQSGNVGIGTNPGTPKIQLINEDTVSTALYANNNLNTGLIVRYQSGLTFVGNNFNNPICLVTNDTERMRIDSSGNCSIGTATALSKLHVHGDVTLSNTTTSTTGATGGIAKPATYAGFLTVSINGTSRKIPYYA